MTVISVLRTGCLSYWPTEVGYELFIRDTTPYENEDGFLTVPGE